MAGLMALLCLASQPLEAVKVLRTVTVWESEEHLNFPWVFRGPGAFLSFTCSIGQHTVTERGMALVSEDDGETWTPRKGQAVEGQGTLLRDGRAVQISCGASEVNAQGGYPITTHYYKRGGRELTKTVPGVMTLPFRIKPYLHRSLVEMPEGTLLATFYGTQEGHKKYSSVLVSTDDGGRNWRFLSAIAHSEEVGQEGFCEPALVRLANGDLLCAMRVGGPLHLCRSTDGGRTWSEPAIVADHGVCPHLLLMRSGVLVLSYGRPNVDLVFSPDGTGKEWVGPLTLYRGMGCSYSSLVEAQNGDLMAFFSQSAFCGEPGPGPLNMIRMARLSVRFPARGSRRRASRHGPDDRAHGGPGAAGASSAGQGGRRANLASPLAVLRAPRRVVGLPPAGGQDPGGPGPPRTRPWLVHRSPLASFATSSGPSVLS